MIKKIQNTKFWLLGWSFMSCVLGFTSICYAQEITILYTGETHAMLYQCSCPVEQDGGVARRATLIKQLRKDNPGTLLVDIGRFFAGGLLDEYTLNTELDLERARVNLKAMELMKYDAVAISDDEFNFGEAALRQNLERTNLAFLSCNISADNSEKKPKALSPYIIKEVSGTKIGIIGVTSPSARQKAAGLNIIEPKAAVKEAVKALKEQQVPLIILLSNLDEAQSADLIKENPEINVLVIGRRHTQENHFGQIGSTLVLKSSWQGRQLGKAWLLLKDNKIVTYKVDELRLSNKIADAPEILSVLPACFSDINCKKEALLGTCQEPGALKSRCIFSQPAKISLLVILPKVCKVCNTQNVVDFLKRQFPALNISYLYYPDSKAEKIMKDFGVKALPAYFLGKEVEKEKAFENLKSSLEKKGDSYMLKPELGGIAYFAQRKPIKGKLDLLLSLYGNYVAETLDAVREFNPVIHFLAVEQADGFDALKGRLEVEDDLRSVCVQKYYPGYFWHYISCRARNTNSSWWEDCLPRLDMQIIRSCAKSEEGKLLLRDNISLSRELEVMFGPAYLLDNHEIFASKEAPDKEELRRIIKK